MAIWGTRKLSFKAISADNSGSASIRRPNWVGGTATCSGTSTGRGPLRRTGACSSSPGGRFRSSIPTPSGSGAEHHAGHACVRDEDVEARAEHPGRQAVFGAERQEGAEFFAIRGGSAQLPKHVKLLTAYAYSFIHSKHETQNLQTN